MSPFELTPKETSSSKWRFKSLNKKMREHEHEVQNDDITVVSLSL